MRLISYISLIAAALLATTACGGDRTSRSVALSPSITSTSPSAAVGTSILSTVAAKISAMDSFHLTKVSGAETVTGDFDTSTSGPTAEVTITIMGTKKITIKGIVVGGAAYFSLPQATGAGKFARIDSTSTLIGPLLGSLASTRPGDTYTKLIPAVKNVHDLGAAKVGTDVTEHYLLDIDSAKSHELLNPGVKVPGSAESDVPAVFHYNLFVTRDGLLRRVQYELKGVTTTMEFTRWGAPVRITAPPQSEVVPMPQGY